MQKVWSMLRSCITNYCRSKLPFKLVNSISFRSIRDVAKRNLKRIILGHLNINAISLASLTSLSCLWNKSGVREPQLQSTKGTIAFIYIIKKLFEAALIMGCLLRTSNKRVSQGKKSYVKKGKNIQYCCIDTANPRFDGPVLKQ